MNKNPDSAGGGNVPQQSDGMNGQQPGPMLPALQLTPEQVNALLAQLYALQTGMQGGATPPPTESKEKKPEGNTSGNSGKRILYQSDDFDEVPSYDDDEDDELFDESQALPQSSSSGRRTLYDEDSLFEINDALRRSLNTSAESVETTNFGSAFSVAEIEIDNSQIASVKRNPKKDAETRRGVIPQGADYSSAVSIDESLEVETVTLPVKKKAEPKPSAPGSAFVSQNNSFAVKAPAPAKKALPEINVEEIEEVEIEAQPKKKKISKFEIIRRTILTISLIAIVISGGVLFREYKLHKENISLESEISDLIISEAETTTEKPTKKSDKNKTTKKPDKEQTTALTPQMQWDQIKKEFPNIIFPVNIQLKYARLYATNTDFVGYLSAEGINLSLPIVQTDNDRDYLNKNFYGKSTKYGCPFVTHVNHISPLDMNTIIFGHHMNNGTVFGALDQYKTIDGFKKAPVITFNTLYENYKWKVIAAFITNAEEKDDNGYVFKYYFASLSSEERFAAYFNELAKRSLYDTGVDVLPSDKILTLSTCSHEFDDARFVVVARLVRPGESEAVNVDNAVVNSKPKYPQAYYDKKKLSNPYKNDERWEVG